jgi:hypothetical protein
MEASVMLPPLPQDPFVRPDWRHLRATHLAAEGRPADHPRDDDRSREPWRLYRDLEGADEARRAALLQATPLGEAYAFHAAAEALRRDELEARLLARQTDEEVAAYHDLYCCVRPRLDAKFYILNMAIGEKLHAGLAEGDRGLLLKLFAHQQGSVVLDNLLDYWAHRPKIPDDPGRLGHEAFAALATKLRLKALLTVLTARADAGFPREYAFAQELLDQLGVAERPRGEPPPAFRAAADAVAGCCKELERLEESMPPPVAEGASDRGDRGVWGAASPPAAPVSNRQAVASTRLPMRAAAFPLPALALSAALLAGAPPGDAPPPRVTQENFDRIKEGKGKLTEAEVEALLGPAAEVRVLDECRLEEVWVEEAVIRVEFKDGKAAQLVGRFSDRLRSATINRDVLKKLRRGMSEADVQKALGPADEGSASEGGAVRVWRSARQITVQFTEGKVSGYLWVGPAKE